MLRRKKFFTILSICFLATISKNAAADDGPYGFPFHNPLIATIMSFGVMPDVKYETLSFEPKSDRRNVPLLKNRNQLTLHLFAQNHEAPLAFVVAGLGGAGDSNLATVVAADFFKAGYSAVTVPDPLSWNYAVARSESGLPGDLAGDAPEYYTFLQEVTKFLKDQKNLKISGFSLAGYSFGGLFSAFLTQEDLNQHVFNFKKVVLINPAIDIQYGMSVLDRFYDAGDSIKQERKDFLMGGLISMAVDSPEKLTPALVLKKFRDWKVTHAEERWLIGQSYRSDLRDMILASQQVHDMGVLKVWANEYHWNAREEEAGQYSFEQYVLKFVLPATLGDVGSLSSDDLAKILAADSLTSLDQVLKNQPQLYVMENEDDILIRPADLDFLKANLGDRLTLYPYGGHGPALSYAE